MTYKYKIIVDMYETKSESRREWEFEAPMLSSLKGVGDELIIEQGKLKVRKRIGITKYNNYYLMQDPVETMLELVAVKNPIPDFEDRIILFSGVNYVSVEGLNGEVFLKYIVNSPFVDGLMTKADLKSEIKVLEQEITMKVTKGNIISEINLTPGEARISADKIALEGYTTINDGFSIDEVGNMTCNDATINGGLVVKDGLYACLVFQNVSDFDIFSNNYTSIGGLVKAGYNRLGYWSGEPITWGYRRLPIMIPFSLPENFDVEYAEVKVEHQSVNWLGVEFASGIGGNSDIRNFYNSKVKNIELYINNMPPDTTSSLSMHLTAGGPSEDIESFMTTRVTGAWNGSTTYNFANGLRKVNSIDVANYVQGIEDGVVAIAPQKKKLPKGSGDGTSDWAESKEGRESTALMKGTLYVYGYLKMVSND